mgnify:CR=1 FL=1
MKAPEKIYIDANEDWHRTYTVFTEKAKGNDIEYTRTDAFIEKAAEWLEAHSPFVNDDILDVWLDNFKEAMKL